MTSPGVTHLCHLNQVIKVKSNHHRIKTIDFNCFRMQQIPLFMFLFCFLGPEEVWENKGHDVSDSAGRISIKTTVYEKMTPPSFSMKDENFIAFSTAAEGPAVHPLQPITDQVVPTAEGFPKGKPRKARGSKALWTNTSGI